MAAIDWKDEDIKTYFKQFMSSLGGVTPTECLDAIATFITDKKYHKFFAFCILTCLFKRSIAVMRIPAEYKDIPTYVVGEGASMTPNFKACRTTGMLFLMCSQDPKARAALMKHGAGVDGSYAFGDSSVAGRINKEYAEQLIALKATVTLQTITTSVAYKAMVPFVESIMKGPPA